MTNMDTAEQLLREALEAEAYLSTIESKESSPPAGMVMDKATELALTVLLNHIEPGWDNCKAVVESAILKNTCER